MTKKNIKTCLPNFLSLNIQICLFLCKIIAISLKKSHLSLSQQPLLQNSGLVKTPTPSAHFWKFGTRFEKQKKEGADHVGIPSPLFSYFLLHKSRYAHVLESLFNNIRGLTVAVLLTTVLFSYIIQKFEKDWI